MKLSLNINIFCNVTAFLNEKVSAFEYEGKVNVNKCGEPCSTPREIKKSETCSTAGLAPILVQSS